MILVLFWAKEFGQLRNESVNSRWVAVRRWLALVKMTWIERLVWLTSTSSLRSLSLRSNWSIFLLRSELFSVKLVNDRSVSFAMVRSNVFKLSKFVSSFFNSLRVVWKRNTKSNRSRKFLFDWEMKKTKQTRIQSTSSLLKVMCSLLSIFLVSRSALTNQSLICVYSFRNFLKWRSTLSNFVFDAETFFSRITKQKTFSFLSIFKISTDFSSELIVRRFQSVDLFCQLIRFVDLTFLDDRSTCSNNVFNFGFNVGQSSIHFLENHKKNHLATISNLQN